MLLASLIDWLTEPTLPDVAVHALLGVVFALTGAYARSYCNHLRHQLALGGTLIFIEAYLSVLLVG